MRVLVPASVLEALRMLDDDPAAVVLAGGTDVMVGVNLHHDRPATVVSLRRLDELRELRADWIGAGVTFARLEASPYPALAQLARTVGSPQIRSAATIGGNLGTASPAGDSLPFLLAADAEVHLRSAGGERTLPVGDFLLGPKRTARAPGELITGVRLRCAPADPQAFAKLGTRSAMVIAVASVVALHGRDGWRLAAGSVAPTAIRIPAAEARLDEARGGTGEPVLDAVRDLVAAGVRPIDDHRSTAAFRRHVAGVLAARSVQRCLVA
jgi:CO/xanthine dehydrogenase FAD-binding subunit